MCRGVESLSRYVLKTPLQVLRIQFSPGSAVNSPMPREDCTRTASFGETGQNMFSSRTFFTRFHEYSRRRRLIEDRNKIIVAVSGGADSMVLLDLLAREQDVSGIRLIVAHFNFQLRGAESDGDEQLVIQRA